MPEINPPVVSRGFSRVDGNRVIVLLPILLIVGASYWFLLPLIQAYIIPDVPGGKTGPWVLRPIVAFRFSAVAVLASMTAPLIIGPLRKKWRREDAELQSRYDPFVGRRFVRVRMMLAGLLLMIGYGIGLLLYLSAWQVIGPDGIDQHLPWTTLHHSFQDIELLETVPSGDRSDSLKKNGPWYSVTLRSGRSITWSLENEGITPDELTAMTAFVADRCGLVWVKLSDAHPR